MDVDVLARTAFRVYGDPSEPQLAGGLTWSELREWAGTVISRGSCVGMSVGVYKPELDPAREDARNLGSPA